MIQKIRNMNKGFTLIELMVVIAIIAILLAIAIPNFRAHMKKDEAQKVKEQNAITMQKPAENLKVEQKEFKEL